MIRGRLRFCVGLGSEPDEGARAWPLWRCRSAPAPHRLKAGLQTEFSNRLLDNHYSLSRRLAHGQEFVWRQDGDFAGGVIGLVAGDDCADLALRLRREVLNRVFKILET